LYQIEKFIKAPFFHAKTGDTNNLGFSYKN
jgi:hypothetical protein